jgi:Spy/CpxP family protein refolding chaperone
MDASNSKPSMKPVSDARRGGAKRWMAGVITGVVVAVAGTAGISAWAQPARAMHGGGGPGMFMGDPAMMSHGLDRLLDSVNATDAQRSQIKQIAAAAANDLKAQREQGHALRDQGRQLFMAPVVDARAVETVRQQTQALHDQTSKRITQAMLDISTVLTPEQRVKIGERIKQREDKMRAHHPRGASAPDN